MGFLDAMNGSGEDDDSLVNRLRKCLRRTDFPADPDRVFNNMDSDSLVPDLPEPGKPASRLALLDELRKKSPLPTTVEDKGAVKDFCRAHKQEGPKDTAAAGSVLGRVWPFGKLDALFKQKGKVANLRLSSGLRDLIKNPSLRQQQEKLAGTPLGDQLMWSFYDPTDEHDPFRSFGGGSDTMVDRLGLGKDWNVRHDLVKWGHRLPAGIAAHTATAWDGGAENPYWYPGGRTLPLSADGGGTRDPSIGHSDGLPEVVHDPVTGSQLAVPIAFLAR
ncbi:MAG: hypothetical protein FJ291_24680 [Planctomycetes bacterium]|nr:hypothetical protein [Planctomycetota bacterium]